MCGITREREKEKGGGAPVGENERRGERGGREII